VVDRHQAVDRGTTGGSLWRVEAVASKVYDEDMFLHTEGYPDTVVFD